MNPHGQSYEAKRDRLARSIKDSSQNGLSLSLDKKSSNLFRARKADRNSKKIDVRAFNRVLSVDREKLQADVEGMVTYEELLKKTLELGCAPLVVPELKSITVGGAAAGCGIESSSFRYGLAHEGISEMELLLGSGDTVTCSPGGEYSDLFYAFPNTFGTLGYALRLKVELMPVKKYLSLHHRRFGDIGSYFTALARLCREQRSSKEIAYIDGVIFSPEELYLTTASFVDSAPFVSNYRYRHIYYRSLQKLERDYLTVGDYLWRWDPDWFWCSKVFYLQNPIIRTLLGKWLLSSTNYAKAMHFFHRHPWFQRIINGSQPRESVIQDVLVPSDKAEDFFTFLQREIGIFPIWICPAQSYRRERSYTFCPLDTNGLYFDFGFWDSIPTRHENGYHLRKIEESAMEIGAFKSLYSTSYYSKEQFWQLYDSDAYSALKRKYDPQGRLLGLYEKACAEGSFR